MIVWPWYWKLWSVFFLDCADDEEMISLDVNLQIPRMASMFVCWSQIVYTHIHPAKTLAMYLAFAKKQDCIEPPENLAGGGKVNLGVLGVLLKKIISTSSEGWLVKMIVEKVGKLNSLHGLSFVSQDDLLFGEGFKDGSASAQSGKDS